MFRVISAFFGEEFEVEVARFCIFRPPPSVASPVAVESIVAAFEAGMTSVTSNPSLSDDHAAKKARVAFVVRLCSEIVPLLVVRQLMASAAPAEVIILHAAFVPADSLALAEDRQALDALLPAIRVGMAKVVQVSFASESFSSF